MLKEGQSDDDMEGKDDDNDGNYDEEKSVQVLLILKDCFCGRLFYNNQKQVTKKILVEFFVFCQALCCQLVLFLLS